MSLFSPPPPPTHTHTKVENCKDQTRPVLWGLWIECPTACLPHIRWLNTKDPPRVSAVTIRETALSVRLQRLVSMKPSAQALPPHTHSRTYSMRVHSQAQGWTPLHVALYSFSPYRHKHTHTLQCFPVPKPSWLMHSFHPPVAGRNEEGDDWLLLIWIFKLFITRERCDPCRAKGAQGRWMRVNSAMFGFDSVHGSYCLRGPGKWRKKTTRTCKHSCWFQWTYFVS